MSKFKVGDKARVVYVRTRITSVWKKGVIVVIQSLSSGITPINRLAYDCAVTTIDGTHSYAMFDQLEPITDQLSSWEEIQSITNWNPSKQGVTG